MIKLILTLLLIQSVQAQELNPLFYRQWGIQNEGQVIYIRESDLNFPAQPGIPGKDINYISQTEIESTLNRKLEEVVVAVIDTGVDLEHEDLKDRFWTDSEGKIGKNFLNPAALPLDDKGHGTHVAGIIAANNNEIGVMGIGGKNIKIMPLKVLNRAINSFSYNRKLISDYFAEAIEYAVANGADVINMSVGFPQLVLTDKFRNAINKAESAQIPVIVAAGNNRKDLPVFPCNLSGVLCVGAVDNTGTFSVFSNYGQSVDILGPGESIVSTYPMTQESRRLRIMGYEKLKGTSQAAPSIAAIAAMIKSAHPTENLNELKARLLCRASDATIKDEKFSLFGIVDMKASILGDVPACLSLNFKEKNQIVINSKDLSFEYNLEIQKLAGETDDIEVEISADDRILFTNSKGTLESIADGSQTSYLIQGKFQDSEGDSIVPFTIKLKSNQKSYEFKANMSFSLGTDAMEMINLEIPDIRSSDIYQARGARRFSLLSYVYSASNQRALPEYFYKKRASRTPEFGFIRVVNNEVETLSLKLEVGQRLINILKGDYGRGTSYLALIQELETKTYHLRYLDNDFKTIENYKFVDSGALINLESPINRDGNLLNFQKRIVNFEWIKHGDLLVPVVTQEGLLPGQDNSNELVDFESPDLSVRRYALIPNVDKYLIPRSLLSVMRRDEIRENLYDAGVDIYSWENIRIENVLRNANGNGEALEYLLSIGEFYERRYFRYRLNTLENYNLEPIYSMNAMISGNTHFPQAFAGTLENTDLVSYRLIERSTGRVAYTNVDTIETHIQEFETDGYADPVFGFLSGVNINGEYGAFVESRYWIHFFGDKHFKYPVNRESSFPGVQFSETMEPVLVNQKGISKMGVFVNSTLLYGNQIHAIVPGEDRLIRPLKYTVEIPENCAYMLPANLEKQFDSLLLNCIENRKSILKVIDLN